MTLPSAGSRPTVALAMLAPAVAIAAIVLALEGYRALRPDSILFTEPPAASFADGLMHREVELAYAFVRDGADPNAVLTVEDAALTGGRQVEVSP